MPSIGIFADRFSPLHCGHIAAIVRASAMVDALHVVVATDDAWEWDHLYRNARLHFFPSRYRERWLRAIFLDHPHVQIHAVHLPCTGDDEADRAAGAEAIMERLGTSITHVFFSGTEDDAAFEELYPRAERVLIQPDRRLHPVSSAQIRAEGALRHWEMIPTVVRAFLVKKVVLVGPESTGKTVLARNLAMYYNTEYVGEYKRTLLDQVGDNDTLLEDYPRIAMAQYLAVYEARKRARKVLFVDTEALVAQNYSGLYEGFHQRIIDEIARLQDYDLVLYLSPDVPWVDDGTRVFGEEREEADAGLRALLAKHGVEVVEDDGTTRKVPVTLGLFAGGRVEISGEGLSEGLLSEEKKLSSMPLSVLRTHSRLLQQVLRLQNLRLKLAWVSSCSGYMPWSLVDRHFVGPSAADEDLKELTENIEALADLLDARSNSQVYKGRGVPTTPFLWVQMRKQADRSSRLLNHVQFLGWMYASSSRVQVVDGMVQSIHDVNAAEVVGHLMSNLEIARRR